MILSHSHCKLLVCSVQLNEACFTVEMPLNADQMKVVLNCDKHVLLNAPPGCGKTEALAERIVHLIKDKSVEPSEILCVTHTIAASMSMRLRIEEVLGFTDVHVTTLHSLAHQITSFPGFHLASALDRRLASGSHGDLYSIMDGLVIDDPVEWVGTRCDLLAEEITNDPSNYYVIKEKKGQAKPMLQKKLSQINELREAAKHYTHYRQKLKKGRRFVHSDMISGAVRALRSDPSLVRGRYKHIIIDEIQDAGTSQEEFVALLRSRAIMCGSGDPRQSVYSFNGVQPGAFERFKEKIVSGEEVLEVSLTTNYRSTPSIVYAAMRVIGTEVPRDSEEPGPRPKVIQYPTELAEVAGVVGIVRKLLEECPPSDIAILVRKHAYAARFEQALGQVCRITPSRRPDILRQPGFSKIRLLLRYIVTDELPERRATLFRLLNALGFRMTDIRVWWETQKTPDELKPVFEKLDHVVEVAHRCSIPKLLMVMFQTLLSEDSLPIIRTLCVHASEEMSKGDVDLETYVALLDDMIHERISLEESPPVGTKERTDALSFLSCHGSKSMGFPHVIMVGCSESCWSSRPSLVERLMTPVSELHKETTRVFHVGMSRAKRTLVMTYHGRPFRCLADLGDTVDVINCESCDEVRVLEEVFAPEESVHLTTPGLQYPSMSSTLLLDVEDCSLRAYYQRVLGVSLPNPNRCSSAAASTGDVIHKLIEDAFLARVQTGVFPEEVDSENIMDLHKKEAFKEYYLTRRAKWETVCCQSVVRVEYRIDAVFDDIPVTGRVDRWDEYSKKRVIITDYKTGKHVASDLKKKGSRIRTQAAFYIFLAGLHGYACDCVEFDFLGSSEPDRVYISTDEIDELKIRISTAWKELRSPRGCGKTSCSWCAWG